MKKAFLLPLAALAFVACSSDSVIEQSTPPVQGSLNSSEVNLFPVVQGTSRGVLASDASIKANPYGYFYTFIDGYFYDDLTHIDTENALQQRTGLKRYVEYSNNIWGIRDIKKDASNKFGKLYWQDDTDISGTSNVDAGNATAKFIAIAGIGAKFGDNDPETGTAKNESAYYDYINSLTTRPTITVNNIVADQRDVAVAYAEGKQSDLKTGGVPLHFRHAMSQVLFKAMYKLDETATIAQDFGDLRVIVKEATVVNAKNQGELKLPVTTTKSGEAYNAAWTQWSDQEYNDDASFINPAYASMTGKTYAQLGRKYQSILSDPVELKTEGTNYEVDNASSSVGPMLLLPQTTDATTDLTANSVEGAYIMLKVNIQRKYNDGSADKWCRWYPATGVNGAVCDGSQIKKSGEGATVGLDAPQAATELTDEDFAYIAVPVKFDWKPGYKYTFILNFTNLAAGWFAPDTDANNVPYYKSGSTKASVGDPVIPGVHKPVTFAVTVEQAWEDGGDVVPPMQ